MMMNGPNIRINCVHIAVPATLSAWKLNKVVGEEDTYLLPCRLCPHVVVVVELKRFSDIWWLYSLWSYTYSRATHA